MQVKLDAVQPIARNRYTSSKGTVLPLRNDAGMGRRKLVTRFDVIQQM